MIVKLIDSYETGREEFQLTCGYQPANCLLYLLEGSFSCTMHGNEFIAEAGDAVVFDTETPMSRHVLSPIRFLYIKFQLLHAELFPIRAGILPRIEGRTKEDLEQIGRLSLIRTQMGLQMREHYLNDFFLCLSDTPAPPSESADAIRSPSEESVPIAYMKRHLKKGLTLRELAHACNSSISSLESKFKSVYGVSLYQYYIDLRMEEAKRLLAKTSYTVTEIAMRCGYENLFYFCNVFKKQVGMTPTEYRRLHLV